MTYLSTVLADSPVHYWRCADPSGILSHDVGSTPIHLASAISAFPYCGYSGIASNGGSFGEFSGSQQWHPENQSQTKPYSIELWYWPHSFRAGAAQDLFSWGHSISPGITFRLGATGIPQVFVDGVNVIAGGAITNQHWHQAVATVSSGGTVTFYSDAVSQGTAAAGAGTISSPIHIGEISGNLGASFVTEIAVFPSELSSARVTAHFLAQETSSAPVYQVPGAQTGTGGFTGTSAQLDAIIAAVTKVFENTP